MFINMFTAILHAQKKTIGLQHVVHTVKSLIKRLYSLLKMGKAKHTRGIWINELDCKGSNLLGLHGLKYFTFYTAVQMVKLD